MSTGYLGGGPLRIATGTFENALTTTTGVTRWDGPLVQNTSVDATSALYNVNFVNNSFANPAILHISGVYGFVGIRTNNPATQLNNQSSTATQTDGTLSVGAQGFGFTMNEEGYAGAISNSYNVQNAYGLLVRAASTNADSTLLNVLGSGTAVQGLIVKGDARVGIGSAAFDATNPERLLVQAGTAASVNVMSGYANADSYRQISIKNSSAGTLASSEFTATANTGSETANFISVGINSSAYADPNYTIGGALAGYIFSNGGNLTVGTQTAATEIRFHTAGTLAAQQRMVIKASGFVGVNTTSPATLFTNSSILPGDGSTTLNPGVGFGWVTNGNPYYAAAFYNIGGNALLVSTGVSASSSSIARFLYNGTTSALTILANGYVGFGGTIAPASVLNNQASLAQQTDGTTALATVGFGWQTQQSGYSTAIVNNNNAANSNGLLVRVARSGSDAYVFRALYNGTTNALSVRADGRSNFNSGTNFNGIVQVTTSGTIDAVYIKSATTATRGPLIFTQDDIQTWGVGPVGAGNQFQIDYSNAGRGVFMATTGMFGLGITVPQARLHVGTGGYANTSLMIIQDNTGNKLYEAVANAGVMRQAWNGATVQAKPTISGSRAGNPALADLLTALANYGLITDSTTA